MQRFDDLAFVDYSWNDKTVYTPFVDEGRAGLVCELVQEDEITRTDFIYFYPSDTRSDEPDVFVYQGADNDPASDAAQHFYKTWEY